MKKRRKLSLRIGIASGAIVLIVWSLIPYGYAVILSLSGPRLPTKLGLPETFSLDSYRRVLENPSTVVRKVSAYEPAISPIWTNFINSIVIASLSSIITILISSPAAYSFSRARGRFFNFTFFLILIFRMIPYITMALPLFFLISRLKLEDTRIGLIIAYTIIQIPFAIWLMKGFFDMVPKEVEEAALVDGAPRITIFRVIVLPLVASGLVVTSVFVFLFCYTEMQFAVVLTASRAMTMPLKLSGYVGINFAYLREMVAAALVSMIPIIVLFSVIQKHMVRGLTFGSIK